MIQFIKSELLYFIKTKIFLFFFGLFFIGYTFSIMFYYKNYYNLNNLTLQSNGVGTLAVIQLFTVLFFVYFQCMGFKSNKQLYAPPNYLYFPITRKDLIICRYLMLILLWAFTAIWSLLCMVGFCLIMSKPLQIEFAYSILSLNTLIICITGTLYYLVFFITKYANLIFFMIYFLQLAFLQFFIGYNYNQYNLFSLDLNGFLLTIIFSLIFMWIGLSLSIIIFQKRDTV
jgi:hypothetical protein